MKIVFGTTNNRKIADFRNIVRELNLDIDILGLSDINWDRGEIEENGSSLEENSLIKAQAIYNFCKDHDIDYPIITDDAGLFCDGLNGEPGIYTARYADDELAFDPSLPKHQCIYKLLKNLENIDNRNAKYRCVVTCMNKYGDYIQESSESNGVIAKTICETLKKPYFYSVFILENTNKYFSELSEDELKNTYRYVALTKILNRISKQEN